MKLHPCAFLYIATVGTRETYPAHSLAVALFSSDSSNVTEFGGQKSHEVHLTGGLERARVMW